MAGWRGAAGASSIPLTKHGSGGQFGGQLAGPGTNVETGQPAITNLTGMPVRQMPFNNLMANTPSYIPGQAQPVDTVGAKYGVPGRPIHDASGNPGVASIDPRSTRPTKNDAPPWGAGQSGPYEPGGPGGTQQRPQEHVPNVLHEVGWRGGFQIANDKLWATDRHGILNTGTERGGGRGSGFTDPPLDGPPRPALRLVQRTINYQQGTDTTRNQDQEEGENRNYTRSEALPPGYQGPLGNRRIPALGINKTEPGTQYIAEQGTGWSPVYGGVPGLWQPYGSYAGYTADEIKGIQSPAEQGSAADGPQKVWSGLPHGLHTQTYPDYATTLGRYLAVPQMALPRIDRPDNSKSSGQSFSQTVQPQGQTGTIAQQVGNQASGVNWRNVSSGWRGIRPGGGQT